MHACVDLITQDVGAGKASRNDRWEGAFTEAFIHHAAKANVIVDVGAEFGFYTRLALKHGPPDVRVLAFEPEPDRIAALKGITDPRVTVFPIALADREGMLTGVQRDPDWSISVAWSGRGKELDVPVTRFDAVVSRKQQIDLIKIDIEGAETMALRGMAKTLERWAPTLLIEFHAPRGRASSLDRNDDRVALAAWLTRAGYLIDQEALRCIREGGRTVLVNQNTVRYQREHWQRVLSTELHFPLARLGYAWGDPDRADDPLGNYAAVLARVRALVRPNTTVLEIGSYGGKWTQYLLSAHRVICIDLFPESHDVLLQRFGPEAPITFYRTSGDELSGIETGSVDVVFSMDSIVRAPREAIAGYIRDVGRVLAPAGVGLIHVPFNESAGSVSRGFTSLTRDEINQMADAAGLYVTIDSDTIVHGALLTITSRI